MNAPKTLRELSCADDYDPNSMPVDTARALIRQFLDAGHGHGARAHPRSPRTRARRGRRLAAGRARVTTIPRWTAGRCASPTSPREGSVRCSAIGDSFAGKPFDGALAAGEAVRIFTGGVMPPGADTVVMQERASELPGGVDDRRRRAWRRPAEPPLRRRGPEARRRSCSRAARRSIPPSSACSPRSASTR